MTEDKIQSKINEVVDEINSLIDLRVANALHVGTDEVSQTREELIKASNRLLKLKLKTALMMLDNKIITWIKDII